MLDTFFAVSLYFFNTCVWFFSAALSSTNTLFQGHYNFSVQVFQCLFPFSFRVLLSMSTCFLFVLRKAKAALFLKNNIDTTTFTFETQFFHLSF